MHLPRKKRESLWSMFIGAFNDIWIKVLCLALVLKIVLAILGVIVPALGGENDVIEIISIVIAIALATWIQHPVRIQKYIKKRGFAGRVQQNLR